MGRFASYTSLSLIVLMCASGCPSPPDYDPAWYDGDAEPTTPRWRDDAVDQGDDTPLSTPPAQGTAEAFALREREVITNLFCEALFSCPLATFDSDYRLMRIRYASKQECRAHWWDNYSAYAEVTTRVMTQVEAGRLALDLDRSNACLTNVEEVTSRIFSICKNEPSDYLDNADCLISEGQVLTGGRCHDDDECAGHDARCRGNSAVCNGTCVRGATQCDPMCEDDFYCNPDTDQCEPLAKANESCLRVDCMSGFYCQPRGEHGERFCERIKKEGEFCEDPGACEDGFLCSQNPMFRVCMQPPDEGQSCEFDYCRQGLMCAEESRSCTSGLEIGSPCNFAGECNDEAICEEGECVRFSSSQLPTAHPGEPCLEIDPGLIMPCATGLYCTEIAYDFDTGLSRGICTSTPPQVGDACGFDDARCGPMLVCGGDGQCIQAQKVDPGELCMPGMCARGYCGPAGTCVTEDYCGLP